MKNIIIKLSAVVVTLLLSGCGSDNPDTSKTGVSYYLDNAVGGVSYSCGTQEGKTDKDGKFNFDVGKDCTFSLAGITLRTTTSDKLVDKGNIIEDNLKVAKFLQSIDSDNNLSNGISITDEVIEALTNALDKHDSKGKLPEDTILVVVVADIGNDVEKITGDVRTDAEVLQHLEETKASIINKTLLNSEWSVTETGITETCGEGLGSRSYPITVISYSNSSITLSTPAGNQSGTYSGSNISYKGSYPEDGGTTTSSTELTVSSNDTELNGSSSWTWSDGNGFSCNGTTTISATRKGYTPATTQSAPIGDMSLSDLIVGKTLYSYAKGDLDVPTVKFQDDGQYIGTNMTNGSVTGSNLGSYRIDGNTIIVKNIDNKENDILTLYQYEVGKSIKLKDSNGISTYYYSEADARANPHTNSGSSSTDED